MKQLKWKKFQRRKRKENFTRKEREKEEGKTMFCIVRTKKTAYITKTQINSVTGKIKQFQKKNQKKKILTN